jgi:hypothetical protein
MAEVGMAAKSGPALTMILQLDGVDVLEWAKTVFPQADHVVYIVEYPPFREAYRVLTADNNCLAVAGGPTSRPGSYLRAPR